MILHGVAASRRGGPAAGLEVEQFDVWADDTLASSLTYTLPETPKAGSTLVIMFHNHLGHTLTPGSGWTAVATETYASVFKKEAVGSETGFTVTGGGNIRGIFMFAEVSGGEGSVEVEYASDTVGPPEITPTDSPFVALVFAGKRRIGPVDITGPSGYTDFQIARTHSDSSGNTNRGEGAGARKFISASSEDPPTFTFSATNSEPIAVTISVA